MMDLNGKREQPFSVPLEKFTHGENWQQELALIIYIDVKAGELQPGHHRNVEGIDRCAILGCITGGLGIQRCIRFIAV